MSREWKVGDLALINNRHSPEVAHDLAACITSGLTGDAHFRILATGAEAWTSVSDARPVVVIDLDGVLGYSADDALFYLPAWLRIAADKADAHDRAEGRDPTGHGDILRHFAEQVEVQCKSPKLAEPTGLGAVVRLADGTRWVRYALSGYWFHGDSPTVGVRWDELDVVEVLSEGVAS
jgi:hypothetical protein